VVEASPGQRLRLRFVNAGAGTPFGVTVGGHPMAVTHTDGFPVDAVTVDAVVIGMIERYDVFVTAGPEGTYPIAAVAEAKAGRPDRTHTLVLDWWWPRVAADFVADNPGRWVVRCHNAYHMEGGLEAIVSYVR